MQGLIPRWVGVMCAPKMFPVGAAVCLVREVLAENADLSLKAGVCRLLLF